MANKTYNESVGYTLQWKIENKSHCWLKQGEGIMSPTFIADALEGTKWSLSLYPMGFTDANNVGFYLHREIDCNGPDVIEVNFQLAFLGKGGSFLKEVTALKYIFQKPKRWGYPEFVPKGKVFVTERQAFLPEDTLTVQCTIWNKEKKPAKPKYLYARTVFKVIRRSSVWSIGEFSTLKSGLRHKFRDNLIEFDLVLNEEQDCGGKMVLCMNSFDESIKYFSIKTSIADSDGKKENCSTLEYFADDLKRGVLSSMLLLDKKLIVNKNQYFPNDILSLNCEYVISSQTDLYDFFGSGITLPIVKNETVESINEHYIEKSVNMPFLMSDLKFMYNDALFSDMELRTSTRTFPAHRNILSARSPVFRRMFSNDMKEKNSGQVDITDLDNDTVHRMLLYIYTDSVEDLQFESASKLYVAAEKYEILSLKSRCSSFLKKKLCPTKACEVLLLADQHQDVDLECFVRDYVIEHDKEVFGSQEWKDFMDTNLKLAADIMYRFTQCKIYL